MFLHMIVHRILILFCHLTNTADKEPIRIFLIDIRHVGVERCRAISIFCVEWCRALATVCIHHLLEQ